MASLHGAGTARGALPGAGTRLPLCSPALSAGRTSRAFSARLEHARTQGIRNPSARAALAESSAEVCEGALEGAAPAPVIVRPLDAGAAAEGALVEAAVAQAAAITAAALPEETAPIGAISAAAPTTAKERPPAASTPPPSGPAASEAGSEVKVGRAAPGGAPTVEAPSSAPPPTGGTSEEDGPPGPSPLIGRDEKVGQWRRVEASERRDRAARGAGGGARGGQGSGGGRGGGKRPKETPGEWLRDSGRPEWVRLDGTVVPARPAESYRGLRVNQVVPVRILRVASGGTHVRILRDLIPESERNGWGEYAPLEDEEGKRGAAEGEEQEKEGGRRTDGGERLSGALAAESAPAETGAPTAAEGPESTASASSDEPPTAGPLVARKSPPPRPRPATSNAQDDPRMAFQHGYVPTGQNPAAIRTLGPRDAPSNNAYLLSQGLIREALVMALPLPLLAEDGGPLRKADGSHVRRNPRLSLLGVDRRLMVRRARQLQRACVQLREAVTVRIERAGEMGLYGRICGLDCWITRHSLPRKEEALRWLGIGADADAGEGGEGGAASAPSAAGTSGAPAGYGLGRRFDEGEVRQAELEGRADRRDEEGPPGAAGQRREGTYRGRAPPTRARGRSGPRRDARGRHVGPDGATDQEPEDDGWTAEELVRMYVGRDIRVAVVEYDHERQRVVASHRGGRANDASRRLKPGAVATGVVTRTAHYGVHVRLDDTDREALVHASNVTGAHFTRLPAALATGQRVKAIVLGTPRRGAPLSLSTSALEETPGQMLTDPEACFARAQRASQDWLAGTTRLRSYS